MRKLISRIKKGFKGEGKILLISIGILILFVITGISESIKTSSPGGVLGSLGVFVFFVTVYLVLAYFRGKENE